MHKHRDTRNLRRCAGLAALAAIYSHTWKVGNSLQDMSEWAASLTTAAGDGVRFTVLSPEH